MGIFFSFLPWIAFWILSGREGFTIAAVTSAAIVFFVTIRDIKKHSVKILDLGTLVFFVILVIASFTPQGEWIDRKALPLSNVALFLIALFSILIHKPFTLQYAREQVDPKFWDSPLFYSVSLTISWVWCATFAIVSVTSYLALNHPSMIDRVIHILVFVGAIEFTSWYPDHVKKKKV
jgi:hypothetical protein